MKVPLQPSPRPRIGRRIRGVVLRIAHRRWPATVLGLLLVLPSLFLMAVDGAWETGYAEGLALLAGATGLALLIVGWGGRRPDWIEPPDRQGGVNDTR